MSLPDDAARMRARLERATEHDGADPRPRYPPIDPRRRLRSQFPATCARELLNARTVPEERREAKAREWVLLAYRYGTLHPRDYRGRR